MCSKPISQSLFHWDVLVMSETIIDMRARQHQTETPDDRQSTNSELTQTLWNCRDSASLTSSSPTSYRTSSWVTSSSLTWSTDLPSILLIWPTRPSGRSPGCDSPPTWRGQFWTVLREGSEVAALKYKLFRFKPMLKWPAQPDSLYTVVMSNLDINSRRNRSEQCIYNGENILIIYISSLQNFIRVLALVCCQHSRRLGGWRRGYLWASLPACSAWRWWRPQIRILCVWAAGTAGLQGRGRSHRLLFSANVKRARTFQVGVTQIILIVLMFVSLGPPRTSWRNITWSWQQQHSSFSTPTKLAWR